MHGQTQVAQATQAMLRTVALLEDGVDALADLGSDEAYELLQAAAEVASGSEPGVRRDPATMELLQVLMAAHQRASAARRVEARRTRLRSAVAQVVEAAVRSRELDVVLPAALDALHGSMHCQSASIRAFDEPGLESSARFYATSLPDVVDPALARRVVEAASRGAEVCWQRQVASLVHVDEPDVEPLTTRADRDAAIAFMRAVGAQEMLMAPLGAAGRCQGWIALTRTAEHEPFGPDDVEAVLAIGREVGNAVQHARAFQRQQELIGRLREVGDHKSWFTAALAHQLRTPLTSICLHLEELSGEHTRLGSVPGGPGEADLLADGLAAIDRSTRVIEKSVESLLTLARLEEGARRPDEVVDLQPVVLASAAENASTAQAAGIEIDTSLVSPDVLVAGDRAELEIVVDNVIANAVKYSPGGGRVALSLVVEDGEAVFACADEGIGMTPQDLAQMYTPFHRSPDARRRSIPGSGLGMAIVQAAVHRHGGSIDATSRPDRGTRVELRLPSVDR